MERTTSIVIFAGIALVAAAIIIGMVGRFRPEPIGCEGAPLCALGVTSCNDDASALRTCLAGEDGCKYYQETACACEVVDGKSQCVYCDGCTIDGVCIADGAQHPSDPCQSCDPDTPDAWTIDASCYVTVPPVSTPPPCIALGCVCTSNADCPANAICESVFSSTPPYYCVPCAATAPLASSLACGANVSGRLCDGTTFTVIGSTCAYGTCSGAGLPTCQFSIESHLYPLPRPVGSAPDACTNCLPNWRGKPTVPYSAPIRAFKGRFLDSTVTPEYQQPIRTFRAVQMEYSPTNRRFYGMFGAAVVAFDEDHLFDRLGGPLDAGPPAERLDGGERYLQHDAGFYAETDGWEYSVVDGQKRLYDVDFDDSGHVYAAYSIFGWGVLEDKGNVLRSLKQLRELRAIGAKAGAPSLVLWFKDGNAPYVLIGGSSGYDVYSVADPRNPALRRSSTVFPRAWARTPDGAKVAITSGTSSARVYTAAQLVSGAAPMAVESPRGLFYGVAADEKGFWLGEEITNNRTHFGLWRVDAATRAVTRFDIPCGLSSGCSPRILQYGDGFIGVIGTNAILIIDVTGDVPRSLGLEQWAKEYYFTAPAGYAEPPGYMIPSSALPHAHDGKTYLIYSGYGLGDVYEIATT
jgi:hypothetical protein